MSPAIDGRRHRWVALPVNFAFDRLGTRLFEEFGYAGIAIWACLFAAAKRNPIEGRLTYGSEADGWAQLGLPPSPDFTLEELFDLTGRMKKTRRTRDGRGTHIEITGWEDLQHSKKRQHEAEQKAKSRRENSRTKDGPTRPDHDHDKDPDLDSGRGKQIAIEEASRDKANGANIGDAEKVGAWRFDDDPEKYNGIFDHREEHRVCVRCDDKGMISEYSPGAGQVTYECHAVMTEATG